MLLARPEIEPKTPLGRRIREVRARLEIDDRDEFAARLGISKSALAHYERGEREPDASVLSSYRNVFGINANWLLTGDGEVYDDPSKVPMQPVKVDAKTVQDLQLSVQEIAQGMGRQRQSMERLPRERPSTFQYYGIKASAGGGAAVLHEVGVPLDLETLSSELLGVSSAHIDLLTVKGDSMLPTLTDGDLVFVDRRKRRIEDIDEGAVYLVSIDGDLYVKRAHWREDGIEVLEWVSDNELFEPIRIEGAGYARMTLLGRIISFWHRL